MIDKDTLLRYNRHPEISSWFQEQLEVLTEEGVYHNKIEQLRDTIVSNLKSYREEWDLKNIFIGMSGGIDSAVTAALFKEAGWNVTGVTMPIHQVEAETTRGREACEKLDITHIHADLTEGYELFRYNSLGLLDQMAKEAPQGVELSSHDKDTRVRLGNVRARMRMITLYNLASLNKGIVASTDNFSELAAGFWTLHGDVGDLAPIQSLTKSWEVPALAELLGVPESIISAKPTDGLGVANGDEDQFGFSYLEFDIALFSLFKDMQLEPENEEDKIIVENVRNKLASTIYKRFNPFNIPHPLDEDRYSHLEKLDNYLRRF
jgi:nicotinamide-nucleotide amidase|tara:strand:- start:610 stop:1569 length:960 start_codon:yes stop_codon:yes gene_type:complete